METGDMLQLAGLIFTSVMASTGFWALIRSRSIKRTAQDQLLLGLANQQMIVAAKIYLERGWIELDEYHNFMTYLWIPYQELGGNGLGAKVANEIQNLPIRGDGFNEQQTTVS